MGRVKGVEKGEGLGWENRGTVRGGKMGRVKGGEKGMG